MKGPGPTRTAEVMRITARTAVRPLLGTKAITLCEVAMDMNGEAADNSRTDLPRRITAQGRTFGKVIDAPGLMDVQAARRSSSVGCLVEIVEEALERTSRRVTGARKRISETS